MSHKSYYNTPLGGSPSREADKDAAPTLYFLAKFGNNYRAEKITSGHMKGAFH